MVALTNINWFYPSLFYGAVIYVAAQRYFYSGDGSPELGLEEQRAQNTAVQTYLDQMTELLLQEKLRTQPPDSDVHLLARALTMTVLQKLDGNHKRGVVLFLYESHLIDADHPLLGVHRADLRRANLDGLSLRNAYLRGANLRGADLRGSDLRGSDLSFADLSSADLRESDLRESDLSSADLSSADLSGSILSGSILSGASGTTSEELENQAGTLGGATMPDGQKYED